MVEIGEMNLSIKTPKNMATSNELLDGLVLIAKSDKVINPVMHISKKHMKINLVSPLDKKTLILNDKANFRLKTQETTLARRKRTTLAQSLYLAEIKQAKVLTLPPKVSKIVPAKVEQTMRVNTSAEYVFRDRVTGKVVSKQQVGSLPHLYR